MTILVGGPLKRALAFFIVISMCLAGLPFAPSTQALRIPHMSNMQNADAFYYGDGDDEWAGWSVSEAGDFNGDGFGDFLVGAPDWFFSIGPGSAYLVYGKASGWSTNTSLGLAENSFVGTHNGDWAGYSVAGVGDVNGDGFDDILIGAPKDDANLMINNGQAYLFLGRAQGYGKNISVDSAQASFIGEDPYDGAGWAVAGVGDVNLDGYDDFIIGAPFNKDGGSSGSDPYLSAGKVYLILGRASGWTLGQSLVYANASFIGVDSNEQSGFAIGGGGDVNHDGINDFLIGAHYGYGGWGRVYIILGATSGWTKNLDLGPVSSVLGAEPSSDFGYKVDIPGDVNGDGFDDMLVGAEHVNTPYDGAGAAYIISGRSAGWWGPNVSVSGLGGASFVGEAQNDYLGSAVHGAGDVNGDGLADILVGANNHVQDHPYIGRAYLVLGKKTGWASEMNISSADVIYTPLFPWSDNFGQTVGSAGDVNGDGTDDVLIDLGQYSTVYDECGYAFLSFPSLNEGPSAVSSIKAYSDSAYTTEVVVGHQGQQIYVELKGTDANASNPDTALVNVSSQVASPQGFILRLIETGNHSGVYRGTFKVAPTTDEQKAWIKAYDEDIVEIRTLTTPLVVAKFKIQGGMKVTPSRNETTALEDEFFLLHYTLNSAEPTTWTVDTNASWLTWSDANKTFWGTPRNNDVGWYNVNMKVLFNNNGTTILHNYVLSVINTPPKITTKDVLFTNEDEMYWVNYNSTDDGQGTVLWHLHVGPPWLSINRTTGILYGTPTDADVKNWTVHLNVDDGNGGLNWSNFTLRVNNTPDPPKIIGTDKTVAYVGMQYWVDYNVTDPDIEDTVFDWSLETNAFFLHLDASTGILKGTPADADRGVHYVKLMVKDPEGLSDTRSFNINVIPFNNRPWFSVFPSDASVYEGDTFSGKVAVQDDDVGDPKNISISSSPVSAISLASNGTIEWKATRTVFPFLPYVLKVNVSVTDGKETVWRIFNITVIKPRPSATLASPGNNTRIGSSDTILKWSGKDQWDEPLTYDVYLGDQLSDVVGHLAATLRSSGLSATELNVTGLAMGKAYYWTVVPKGGVCHSGYFKFLATSNHLPVLYALAPLSAYVAKDFGITVKGTDPDPEDGNNLTFSLAPSSPAGMTIDPKTGKISWTPSSNQLGKQKLTVRLTDGKDTVERSYYITVKQKTTVSMAAEWPMYLILAIIIGGVSGVVIWRLKKKDWA